MIHTLIKEHALKDTSSECCGLILSNGIYPCQNLNTNPKAFEITPKDYIKASKIGKIMGCYHSHIGDLDGFSLFDRISSEVNKLEYILYVIQTDKFHEYRPTGTVPYIGKEFCFGKNDCFTLIRDYYQKELGITIENYCPTREDDFFRKEPGYLATNLSNYCKMAGFTLVRDIQKNDVLIINHANSHNPSHFAAYLGNDCILHHPRNAFSRIDDYTSELKQRTFAVARYGI